jgi:uncharacterized membrane protein
MTDAAYVAATRRALRRTLFRRFNAMGLGQDQVVIAVAKAEAATFASTNLTDLAAVAASAGEVAAALQAVAPTNPALVSFNAALDSAPPTIRDVFTYEP